ncbi:MAG: FAD-dependent oxidoreductase [Firmicutes bacterium]|nr:FAD-dependent oxidoreductase [Bacillota bacterium]
MNKEKIYDLVIAGAGPAGISAAIYGVRKGLDLLVVTEDIGGQTNWTGDVENYTGFMMITGAELADKFAEHTKKYGIPIKEQEPLVELKNEGRLLAVKTTDGAYTARSVIVATGKTYKKLGVPGEEEFQRRGVAYCATCDAPFFAGKTVAVAGGGNSAFEYAQQLLGITRKTYIINLGKEPTADQILQERVLGADNVELMNSSMIAEITGDRFVQGIKVRSQDGVPGSERYLSVEGVFVAIGLTPNSSFSSELQKNENGEILVDNCNRTNIPGVFAAGDVTDVPHKQIIVAAGEGAKAALSAYLYLVRN